MVLGYWGMATDQEQLARQLGVESGIGVPAGRVRRLASNRLAVTYQLGDWEGIKTWLAKGVPVIAMIQAGELPHWQGEYFQHAVVVVAYDETQLWLLDPAAAPEPITVSIDEFMLAWGELDYRCAILEPPRSI
jgi:hypothetical protein